MKTCKHYWMYPQGIIQGRKKNECAIVRYCDYCNRKEVAFTSRWHKAIRDYALDEHYQ